MQQFLKKHRWSILAAGAAIQVLTGIPSAWGVFQKSVCQGYGLNAVSYTHLDVYKRQFWNWPAAGR